MFGYRHVYHAGNHADVLKHVALVGLVSALARKEAGFCVLDTHAGAGTYELGSEPAQKNREFESGVTRVWGAENPPTLVSRYLEIVRSMNQNGLLSCYPGSPMVARALARPQDRLILTEWHKADAPALRAAFSGDPRVAVHCQDGYQAIKAFLPPKLKRGLVFIDPPYELKRESDDLAQALRAGVTRWPAGVYAVWYPVFEPSFVASLKARVRATGVRKILDVTLTVRDTPEEHRMVGSGLMVVNPPWQFDSELRETLPWLHHTLHQGGGSWAVSWLVPE